MKKKHSLKCVCIKCSNYTPPDNRANLGYATTRQLLDELKARIEVSGELDYRTVDDK